MFISHQSHTVVLTHYALKLWLQLVTFISHKFLHSIICIHFVLKSWIESECPITNVYFTPIVHNHTHVIEIMISISSIYFTQTVAYNYSHTLHWNCDLKVRVWCVQYWSVYWVSEKWKHEDICHCLSGLDGWACFTHLQVTITWAWNNFNCMRLLH